MNIRDTEEDSSAHPFADIVFAGHLQDDLLTNREDVAREITSHLKTGPSHGAAPFRICALKAAVSDTFSVLCEQDIRNFLASDIAPAGAEIRLGWPTRALSWTSLPAAADCLAMSACVCRALRPA